MGSQYDEMEKINAELQKRDKNGTMTKNPGGNKSATRATWNEYLRNTEAGKGIITNPEDAKKTGKAASLQEVEQDIKRHKAGMEPRE